MPVSHFRTIHFCCLILAAVSLLGCGSLGGKGDASERVANAVKPYKIDIIQGNVVTREQLAVLKPGMAQAQVRDILGTPLLTSLFHAQRWDYVFTLQRSGQEPQQRKVTIFFKGDVVDKILADELPSESEFVSTLKSDLKPGKPPVMEASEERLKKFPAATPPASTAPAPTPAPAAAPSYPPLEPARQ